MHKIQFAWTSTQLHSNPLGLASSNSGSQPFVSTRYFTCRCEYELCNSNSYMDTFNHAEPQLDVKFQLYTTAFRRMLASYKCSTVKPPLMDIVYSRHLIIRGFKSINHIELRERPCARSRLMVCSIVCK